MKGTAYIGDLCNTIPFGAACCIDGKCNEGGSGYNKVYTSKIKNSKSNACVLGSTGNGDCKAPGIDR
jgi:hypothetical protein